MWICSFLLSALVSPEGKCPAAGALQSTGSERGPARLCVWSWEVWWTAERTEHCHEEQRTVACSAAAEEEQATGMRMLAPSTELCFVLGLSVSLFKALPYPSGLKKRPRQTFWTFKLILKSLTGQEKSLTRNAYRERWEKRAELSKRQSKRECDYQISKYFQRLHNNHGFAFWYQTMER